jgi:hypothetical protein
MNIEEALELLEREHVEADIKKLSPKDRLNFWASLVEFIRPKIQRATHELSATEIESIIIEYPPENVESTP